MTEFGLFVLTYVLVFIVYQIFIVNKYKKIRSGKKKNYKNEHPLEITYLIMKYKLDINKVNYNQLLQIVAIISTLDISIIVSLMSFLNEINMILCILGGFISIFIVIFISYYFVYRFYKKKGMIKNGK